MDIPGKWKWKKV